MALKTILIGREHDKAGYILIAGPETPTSEAVAMRDAIAKSPTHERWAEITVARLDPLKSDLKLQSPVNAKKQAEADAKADAELNALIESNKKLAVEREKSIAAAAQLEHEMKVAQINKLHASFKSPEKTAK